MAGRGRKTSGAQTAPPGKHKRECHKCRYNGTGDDACLACIGPADLSYKGKKFIFLDDLPDPEGMLQLRIDQTPDSMTGRMVTEEERRSEPKASREIRHVSKLPEPIEEKLIPLIAKFTALPCRLVVVLRSFWRGEDASDGAEDIGIAVDEYARRLDVIRATCPEVMRVCERVRKQHRKNGPVKTGRSAGLGRKFLACLQ